MKKTGQPAWVKRLFKLLEQAGVKDKDLEALIILPNNSIQVAIRHGVEGDRFLHSILLQGIDFWPCET